MRINRVFLLEVKSFASWKKDVENYLSRYRLSSVNASSHSKFRHFLEGDSRDTGEFLRLSLPKSQLASAKNINRPVSVRRRSFLQKQMGRTTLRV